MTALYNKTAFDGKISNRQRGGGGNNSGLYTVLTHVKLCNLLPFFCVRVRVRVREFASHFWNVMCIYLRKTKKGNSIPLIGESCKS